MFFIFLLIFSLFFNSPILASDNTFGLHLSQTEDIHSAAKIINSQNGDWGWATVVIQTNNLDKNTWQNFFDNCRKDHIIPIIRIATIGEGENWKVPDYSDIDHVVSFFNSLNWPTQEQHVILFNEINHGSEWGGGVDIKDFVDKSSYAAKKFKEANPNFFIISCGLDLVAPEEPPKYKSAENVYKEIISLNPNYFDNIDGLSSHSYPNNGFVGIPNDTGQHSIRGYQWELDLLKQLGINKDLPVFITETGWPHREGIENQNNFYTAKTTANFLIEAITNVWSPDSRIKAITPFIYNYSQEPFDHFSWLDENNNLYSEYQQLIDLPKKQNEPKQILSYQLEKITLPLLILEKNTYDGEIILKNTGQSIWGEKRFCLISKSSPNITTSEICSDSNLTLPGQYKIFKFKFIVNAVDNYEGQTYLSWGDLNNFEIQKFAKKSTIYHPKDNFIQRIINSFKAFVIRAIEKN
ncbi:MAG: hypothetical protein PHP97_01040 [Candidatus Shapirobacteria bacterium]|nr:hypothetical protein [Candidatus Shapirobacteria bacterium]MDD4382617.1 hypothetical protein [Candidatus Shapirobacteria bacterium]